MTAALDQVDPAGTPGRNDLGLISIDDRVVERIASRAAVEIHDAGAAAPRVLGRSLNAVSTAGAMGLRATSLTALPKASAEVDGSIVLLTLEISVRWPASVPATTLAVRQNVANRIREMTGLDVSEIFIDVTDLVTDLPAPPRVK